jgi:hypothetical protein
LLFTTESAAAGLAYGAGTAARVPGLPLVTPVVTLGAATWPKSNLTRQELSGTRVLLPPPAQDPWSIQRRLESLGDGEFERTANAWVQAMGDPARRALLLCAGSTTSPGLTISGRERREQLIELTLNLVTQGLGSEAEGQAWRNLLREALVLGEQAGGNPGSPLDGQGALAAINVVARLGLTEFSDLVAAHMLSESSISEVGAVQGKAPARTSFQLHDEAQLCLFGLYGVWFAHREEFQAFPRPPAGQAVLFRDAFAEGAARESQLALQLLEVRAVSGQALLQHPDPELRAKAVVRLVRAVGEQALSPSSVRKSLADSVLRESNPAVSDAMLQGLLDLALAEGDESQAVQDLRSTLQSCAQEAPLALVPSLLSAFDRLSRPDGEAGRDLAVEDGASASQLLESLWKPELRLDRDSTILALRAWSRLQTKLNGFALSSSPQRRAGNLVLQLLANPSEPERVRLVAAEALVGWKLELPDMQLILETLASSDSSASLRQVAYPLVLAGVERLNWRDLDGVGLIGSLLRDMGHGEVDLRGQAIEIASSALLLDRISALEAEQGRVLHTLLTLLEGETSRAVRTGLMDLIIQIAGTTARPDLLEQHLKRPVAKNWIVEKQVELAHLARTYQVLAGVGQGTLVADAALFWVRETVGLGHGLRVREQALDMVLAIDVADAQGLPLAVHRAIYEIALAHLLEGDRAAGLLWSQAHGDRLLSVHIDALNSAPGEAGKSLPRKNSAYLKAKLLAAAVVEDDAAVHQFFEAALEQSEGNPRQRLFVLRDRARFSDSVGESSEGKAEWVRLAKWLSQQAAEGPDAIQPTGLDFEDLGHMTSASERAKLFNLACRLWQRRTDHPSWKVQTSGLCSRELALWAESAEQTRDPERVKRWLAFVETQISMEGAAGLKLPEADQAALGERASRLRSLVAEWEGAQEAAAQKGPAPHLEDVPGESEEGGDSGGPDSEEESSPPLPVVKPESQPVQPGPE